MSNESLRRTSHWRLNSLAFFVLALLIQAGPPVLAATDELVITEIMYDSRSVDVEWIELYNRSGANLDLSGWYVLDEEDTHPKLFLDGVQLAPGEVLLVIEFESAFVAQYGDTVTNYHPSTFGGSWGLNNDGDACRVFKPGDILVDEVWYSNVAPWPTAAAGQGPSLQLTSMGLDNNAGESWQASPADWGTPGEVEASVPTVGGTWGAVKALYRSRE